MKLFSQFVLTTCALSLVVVANPARRDGPVFSDVDFTSEDMPSQETGMLEESLMVSEMAMEDEISCLPDNTCPVGYTLVAPGTPATLPGVVAPGQPQTLPGVVSPGQPETLPGVVAPGQPETLPAGPDAGIPLPETPSRDAEACLTGPQCSDSTVFVGGEEICCREGFVVGSISADTVTFGRRRSTCECIPGDMVRRRRQESMLESDTMETEVMSDAMESEVISESTIPLAEETMGMCMCKKDAEDMVSDESAMPTDMVSDESAMPTEDVMSFAASESMM